MRSKNIPQGYKQTELGIIPEDWEVTTIKQIADITTGNKNTQDAEEGGVDDMVIIPYTTASRLSRNSSVSAYSFSAK